MADIVDSLFGPTPFQIQQAQNAALGQAADKYASQDPFARATGQLYRAGGMLAGPAASSFGMVNPAMEEAARRQAVMGQGGDLSSAAGLKAKAAQFAQAGDQQTAMRLLMAARQMEAQEAKARMDAVEMRRKEAQTERELAMAEKALREPETKVSDLYRKFKEAYPGQSDAFVAEKMREYLESERTGKAKGSGTSITNVMPGMEGMKDIPKFRKDVQGTIQPQLETIYASDKALSALDLALKNNNPIAFQAARTQLAKAMGDSQISLREIEAAGGDPSIAGKILDTGSVLFTGTPTVDTMRNMKRTLEAVKRVAKQKGKAEIDVQRGLAKEAKFTDEQINKALKFEQFDDSAPPVGASVTLKSGKKVQRID